jgi:hypothetical protein
MSLFARVVTESSDQLHEKLPKGGGKFARRPDSLSDFRRASAEVTRKIGEAFNAAVALKGMFDRWEDVSSQRRIYDRNSKIMGQLGSAKQQAYQSEMELRRLK